MDEKSKFWDSLIQAVEAEPKPVQSIRGRSGFSHPVIALGVDEGRNRVVIISGESDPRIAAMAQSDIQSSMESVNVIVARPAPINLGGVAKLLSKALGGDTIESNKWQLLEQGADEFQHRAELFMKTYGEEIDQFVFQPTLQYASLNLVAVWQEVIKQLSLVEVTGLEPETGELVERPKHRKKKKKRKKKAMAKEPARSSFPSLGLSSLMALDPAVLDRKHGICSIPLYELTQAEVGVFERPSDDAVNYSDHPGQYLPRYSKAFLDIGGQ